MDLTKLESVGQQIDEFLWPEQDPKLRQKRERILLAATDLFVSHGYRKTSVDEVAYQAGVAKGTIYLYYRNKAELVYHAVALEKRAHLERLSPLIDASLTPRNLLRTFIAIGVIMSREMPLTTSLIQGDHQIGLAIREIDEQVLADVNKRQMDVMLQLLDDATNHAWSPAQLKVRGQVLVDLLFAVTTSNQMNANSMPLQQYAREVADIIVDGVVNQNNTHMPSTLLSVSTPETSAKHQGAF